MRSHSQFESELFPQQYDASFQSITKCLSNDRKPKPNCPHCAEGINFKERLEWMGPSAFLCPNCGELVELESLNLD